MLMYSACGNNAKRTELCSSVVAGDELLLRLRKVERRPIRLGHARDDVNEEADWLQEDIPPWHDCQPEPACASTISRMDIEPASRMTAAIAVMTARS